MTESVIALAQERGEKAKVSEHEFQIKLMGIDKELDIEQKAKLDIT
jgi:hypothetical protein